MSESLRRQIEKHVTALRKAGDNPDVAGILRAAGMTPERHGQDQLGPLTSLALMGEGAAAGLSEGASMIGGLVTSEELEKQEQGEDQLEELEGAFQAAGGGEIEQLAEQLTSPPKELQEVSHDAVPEMHRNQPYSGEHEHTANPPVRNVARPQQPTRAQQPAQTRDEDYGEQMKRLFHRQPITPARTRDADLRSAAPGGPPRPAPRVDSGCSGVDAVVAHHNSKFGGGR